MQTQVIDSKNKYGKRFFAVLVFSIIYLISLIFTAFYYAVIVFDIHIFGDILAVLSQHIPLSVRAVIGCATNQCVVRFPIFRYGFAKYIK